MKKKGLILIPFLTGYGGTETVIHNLLDEYNKEKNKYNIDFKVYSLGGYKDGDWLQFPEVKVFQFPKERYIREFLYLFLLPLLILYSIIKEKPNFVVSTNPIMWTIAKLWSCLLHKRIKIIAWYHYSYKLKPVNHYCLSTPDYFFTISDTGKKELEDFNVNSNKIFVIYNPVMPTKQIIKPSQNHNKFIYIGRLEYDGQKNINELFKAMALIKNKTWKLKIFGTGPGKKALQSLSNKLKISNNIIWMGFVNDPLKHVRHADALVLTSAYEGFSMVLAEAISRGLYVISSDCPSGPAELINNFNGVLYKPGNIKQLERCICNVLNSKIHVNSLKVKYSISRFYVNNYYNNLLNCLRQIL